METIDLEKANEQAYKLGARTFTDTLAKDQFGGRVISRHYFSNEEGAEMLDEIAFYQFHMGVLVPVSRQFPGKLLKKGDEVSYSRLHKMTKRDF